MIKPPNLNKYLDKKKIDIDKKAILQILNKENETVKRKKTLKEIFNIPKCPKGKKICRCHLKKK